jgi:DNA-binding NarL/FixJ family response regulator
MSGSVGLRIRLHAADPVRRQGLTTMLQAAGHTVAEDMPDVVLCDVGQAVQETEAPVVALSNGAPVIGSPAGVLAADAAPEQLDVALRAVAAGLQVRSPDFSALDGATQRGFFPVAEDSPLLTPREREILALVGEGMSNKSVARRLGISVHTVKFHMEALFAKLDATSRAEAVAKGLRGGVIEL